jgi:hypothetical protein
MTGGAVLGMTGGAALEMTDVAAFGMTDVLLYWRQCHWPRRLLKLLFRLVDSYSLFAHWY